MPARTRQEGGAPTSAGQRRARSQDTEVADGWGTTTWLCAAAALVAAVVIGVVLQTGVLGRALGSAGGVRSLDLEGDDVIRAAVNSGEPWMLFCDEELSRRSVKKYWAAKEVFEAAAAGLAGRVSAGVLTCSRPLEGSRKTLYGFVGLGRTGMSPATVIVVANGRKPRKVPPAFLRSAGKLSRFVSDRTTARAVDIGTAKGMRRCLSARTCVVLAHGGKRGRRPSREVLDGLLARHRTAQIATLDTSKSWIAGLPQGAVSLMPRAARAQPSNATSRGKARRSGKKPARNVTVTGWGEANGAPDATAQATLVIRRDPRPLRARELGQKPGKTGKGRLRALLVAWAAGTGSGAGAAHVTEGDVDRALGVAEDAGARALAAGGVSSDDKPSKVVGVVMKPQEDAARSLAEVTGGQSGLGAVLKRRLAVIRAPRVPKRPAAGGGGGEDGGEEMDARLAAAARRRAAREARRAKARREAAERGEDPESAAEAADDADAAKRAREAMEREAEQWIPEAMHGDDEPDYEYDDDDFEEDDEAGFEEVE